MKRQLRYFALAAAMITAMFSIDGNAQYSRANQLLRPCASTTTAATIRISRAGALAFAPCSGQTTTFGGNLTGPVIFRFASGANDYIQVSSSVGESYFAATAGTNFLHNAVQIFRLQPLGTFELNRTVTPAATVGAQTINKPAGTVNFAAAATSIVVTNSTVSATSIVFPVIRTADATCTFVKSVVPAAGSFTITLNAGCTAETSVGFLVTN